MIKNDKHRNNKELIHTFLSYENLIMACAKEVIRKFPYVPLTWEDLFNHAINYIADLVEKFDPSYGIPISNFLVFNIRLQMMGYCTSFTNKNNQILNLAAPLDEEFVAESLSVNDFDDEYELKDIMYRLTKDLDSLESEIFTLSFIQNKPTKEIAKITGVTSQKINQIIKKFKEKINEYIL